MPWYPYSGSGGGANFSRNWSGGRNTNQDNFYGLGSKRGRDHGTSSGDAALDELNAANDVARVATATATNINTFLKTVTGDDSVSIASIGRTIGKQIGNIFSPNTPTSATAQSTSTDVTRPDTGGGFLKFQNVFSTNNPTGIGNRGILGNFKFLGQ